MKEAKVKETPRREHHEHEFEAFIPKDAKILILGSFPSKDSRNSKFYYMNPNNYFYKILSELFQENFCDCSIEVKKELLTKYGIALYDVATSCSIIGASDSTIKDYELVDLKKIMENHPSIQQIFVLGLSKAKNLFKKTPSVYNYPEIPDYVKNAIFLPSTSPRNRRYFKNIPESQFAQIKQAIDWKV